VNYPIAKEPLGDSHSVCTLRDDTYHKLDKYIGLISIQSYCALREAGMEVLEEKAQQRGEEE
jgi:hypothetical protein